MRHLSRRVTAYRNAADRRSDSYLPGADPRTVRFIEPRETETRTMHALEEYA